MGSEWKTYKVSDIADVLGGGTPDTKAARYWNGDIPWLTPKDLSNHQGRYVSKGERNISEEGLKNSSARIVPPKTVLLSSRAPVGYVAIAENRLCTNQGFRSLVVKDGFDPEFVYYLLLHNTEYLKQHASGSTFQELTGSTLKTLEFQIPSFAEQHAIAHILGSLDDKIELNRKMNETLEAMAHAIFKSWFVDFDPVRAKAEGRDPALPKEIADLFPDSFENSELGEIPKGWQIGCIGDISTQIRQGVKPSELEPDEPYIALEHMPRKSITLHDWSSSKGITSGKFRFSKKNILFGKLRPYFHKVGVPAIDGVCSTDIVVVKPKEDHYHGLLLGHLSSDEFISYVSAASTGTKMPRTNWKDMAWYIIALPLKNITMLFNSNVEAMIDKIHANIFESRTLATTRDTLLSKLLSGEIRIKNAEKIILAETGQHEQRIEAIYTIGHSNHSVQDFITLLKRHAITAIADVRSSPFSRRNPQFNQAAITAALKKVGIAYVFLGEELGGRPNDADCYNNGAANFEKMAERPVFKRGIDRLLTGRDKYRIALLCAEKEPLDCHRTILVCHYLRRLGLPIKHILSDGSIEEHHETERRLVNTFGLDNSLFDTGLSDSERIEKAYKQQARKIVYKPTSNKEHHGHTK